MTRIETTLILMALWGAAFVAGACNRSPEEAHTDAVEAQQEATQDIKANDKQAEDKIAEVKTEAAKTEAEAMHEANTAVKETDKKVAVAHEEARADNAQAQAKANETIRAANVEVASGKSEMQQWGQKKIDDLNNTIDSARADVQKLPAKAQANFDVGLKSVIVKRDELKNELASLEAQSETQATAFKARIDSEVDRLKTRIGTLKQAKN